MKKLILVALMVLPACGSAPDDTAQVQAALEKDNGGFALDEEAPAFGEAAEFAAIEAETPVGADDATIAEQAAQVAGDTDPCGRALAIGRWHDLAPDMGLFRGRVITHAGVVGHLKGIYGVRKDGAHVFFGKVIDDAGHPVALIHGHFGDHRFLGRVIARDGDRGLIAGLYGANPLHPDRGRFLALLHETTCDRATAGASAE